MMEHVELPYLCQGKQSPAQVQRQGELREQSSGHGFQSYTDCAIAPGKSLLNTPIRNKISKDFCDTWRLCTSLASQVSCCVCVMPRGADETLLFWAGDILYGWWYIIRLRKILCISCLINRTRIKHLPIKLADSTMKFVSQEPVKCLKLKPERYVGLCLLFT